MDIFQYLLGGLATVLLFISSVMLNIFIKKLDELGKTLGHIVTDIAVIKKQLDNYESRITSLEHDFKRLHTEFFHLKTKAYGPSNSRARDRQEEDNR